jgi:hypothetical protein
MGMAMTLAPMYRKPTDASSGIGYEHSTVDTIVAGTAMVVVVIEADVQKRMNTFHEKSCGQ